jgi:RimJ/RimL family protein N-acetyltransferase
VLLRRLGPPDLPAVERHLLGLGPQDRQRRFLSRVGDAVVSAYARNIDPRQVILFGALDGPEGALLGLAEVHPTGVPGRLEVAFSMNPAHRGCGLGRRLVAQAVAAAFAAGAEVVEFFVAPDNLPAVGLILSLGGRFRMEPGRLELRRPAAVG